MADATTLPGLALANAKNRGAKPGIREKYHGIWQTWTWAEYYDEMRRFGLGLQALGFKEGDKLAVIGDNRPQLYWAQLAAQALGGASVPVYQDSIVEELTYVLDNAEVSIIVAEDQEQVDKALAMIDRLPMVRHIVYDDGRGLGDYDHPKLISFEDVQERGASGDANAFDRGVESLDPGKIALMSYTSGTTGRPKGVVLSHGNLVTTTQIFVDQEDIRESDDFISYLPMAWVGETTYNLVTSLLTGACSNCPESPETLQRDLREIGPTGMLATPRAWEAVLSEIQVKVEDSTGVKRWVYNTFMNAALAAAKKVEDGEALTFGDKFKRWLGDFLVFAPIRDQYGFRRARWCITGGAPLGPDTFRFFVALGVNLKQLYGATEVSGLVSAQKDEDANPDTAGKPCAGIEVRIAESGEVLVKSPGVFLGYYKNDEATGEAFTDDGWFKTGDAGVIGGNGHLTIIDRAKDVGQLTDGTAFAPQFVENKLKYSPYISEAISFGHERPFVCAMIAIDLSTVGKWAERQSLPYTNYLDLALKPEVRTLIGQEIEQINRTLPEPLRIKRFLLLGKDFDADDAEITRTRKLRRGYIAEHYANVIDAFYGDQDEVDLRAEVTFEDGRKSHVDMRLAIQNAA